MVNCAEWDHFSRSHSHWGGVHGGGAFNSKPPIRKEAYSYPTQPPSLPSPPPPKFAPVCNLCSFPARAFRVRVHAARSYAQGLFLRGALEPGAPLGPNGRLAARPSYSYSSSCPTPQWEHFSMRRYQTNKSSSARQFRGNVQRTRAINVQPRPMRGGFRL